MKTLLVTGSCGGVGATTVAARLGVAIAERGARVLAMEFGTAPAMDLLLGCSEELLYDVTDVTERTVDIATCAHEAAKGFFLIKGAFPLAGAKLRWNADTLSALVKQAEEFGADYLILDVPPTPGLLRILAPMASEAVAVVSPTANAQRAAEALGAFLSSLGVEKVRMTVNGLDLAKPPALSQMIDSTHIPLLGAVPLSESLQQAGEAGVPCLKEKSAERKCFANMAGRILGEQIPLFAGLSQRTRKRIIQ